MEIAVTKFLGITEFRTCPQPEPHLSTEFWGGPRQPQLSEPQLGDNKVFYFSTCNPFLKQTPNFISVFSWKPSALQNVCLEHWVRLRHTWDLENFFLQGLTIQSSQVCPCLLPWAECTWQMDIIIMWETDPQWELQDKNIAGCVCATHRKLSAGLFSSVYLSLLNELLKLIWNSAQSNADPACKKH